MERRPVDAPFVALQHVLDDGVVAAEQKHADQRLVILRALRQRVERAELAQPEE